MVDGARPERDLNALMLGQGLKLEELVDREALGDMARSFFALFGISIRVFSAEGSLAADATADLPLCQFLNTLPAGREACARTVSSVKATVPTGESIDRACFTGASYHVVSIDYDGRRLGRVVLGPYMPLTRREAPRSLLELHPSIDRPRAIELFGKVPRAHDETVRKLGEHARACLSLLIFAGHKTLVTSQMHLATVRDSFHELRENNARLQEAVDKLREADRLKSNFLATVSHELRTPLTSIIGYSEMLLEGIAGELGEEPREFIGTIRDKGDQLLQLILNLLDLSKLESGTSSLKRRGVRVDDILRDVAATLLPAARKKGVELKVEVPAPLPEQSADDEKLRQVFLNLTENALKFTPKGGSITLSVRSLTPDEEPDGEEGYVLFASSPDRVEVRVADTGIGIPPAEAGRVFEAFYQVDSSSTRQYGGTGLGLAIVKRLLDAHDATIRIEPNEPEGTVFVVSLPVTSP